MEAFCLNNLSESVVEKKTPWELDPREFNYPTKWTKTLTYKKWTALPTTRYCAFNLIEGEIPTERIGKDNQPLFIRGLVADFDVDTPFTEEDKKRFLERTRESAQPAAYLSESHNGGFHGIWLFDEPISCCGMASAKEFLAKASSEIGFGRLCSGIDLPAAKDPAKYYCYGQKWQRVGDHRIPKEVASLWMFQATSSKTFKDRGIPIPLDRVWIELKKKFPGLQWPTGEFREGSRGPTFWEPNAGHKSINSAVVRDTGMQCFNSAESGFFTWGQILGNQFVQDFQAGRIGEAVANMHYDGKKFWERLDNGRTVPRTREDVRVRFVGKHHLSRAVPRGATASEVDLAINTILETKLVAGGVPFIFDKRVVVPFMGERYVNTSIRKPTKAAKDPVRWGEEFPFITSLLEGMLGPKQLPYWLSWVSRFYKSAVSGEPSPGHAVFLIGVPGCGKTFINENVLDILFGGHSACGDFLMGQDGGFNQRHFDYGIWTCDDRVPASDARKFQHYTSTVKSIVANSVFTSNEKYLRAGQLRWNGRLSVTANFSHEDARMIPELNESMRDKIMVFRALNHKVKFDDKKTNRLVCRREVPHLARYLLDYETPEELRSTRFGVKGYVDSEVEDLCLAQGRHNYFLELMDLFKDEYFSKDDPSRTEWEGNATELLAKCANLPGANVILKDVTPTRMGLSLSHYASKNVPWLEKRHRRYAIKSPHTGDENPY